MRWAADRGEYREAAGIAFSDDLPTAMPARLWNLTKLDQKSHFHRRKVAPPRRIVAGWRAFCGFPTDRPAGRNPPHLNSQTFSIFERIICRQRAGSERASLYDLAMAPAHISANWTSGFDFESLNRISLTHRATLTKNLARRVQRASHATKGYSDPSQRVSKIRAQKASAPTQRTAQLKGIGFLIA
jgi:hypothetical protein